MSQKDDLISRQAAMDFVGSMEMCDEITAEAYQELMNYLEELPSAQPETHDKRTEMHSCDLISREAAIDEIRKWKRYETTEGLVERIKNLPPAQPELTDGQAIEHLQKSGWMQNHDKQMYEMGLREQLADDSDSYDALLPSAQPELAQGLRNACTDAISRQAAIDAMANTLWHYPNECYRKLSKYEFAKGLAELGLKSVPPAQPEQFVKGCRNCKYGKYNDFWKTHFCYNPNECTEWNLWEPNAQPERPKGKWILVKEYVKIAAYKCSECGRNVWDDTGYSVMKDYPFCHCGAEMIGVEDGQ